MPVRWGDALVCQEGGDLCWLRFHVSFFCLKFHLRIAMDFYIPPVSKWIIPWEYRKNLYKSSEPFRWISWSLKLSQNWKFKKIFGRIIWFFHPGKFILGTQPWRWTMLFHLKLGRCLASTFQGVLAPPPPIARCALDRGCYSAQVLQFHRKTVVTTNFNGSRTWGNNIPSTTWRGPWGYQVWPFGWVCNGISKVWP